ncbi:MAG: hypothetical protein ACAH59_01515 [Pseudobdellovibrionaceae bacterium]
MSKLNWNLFTQLPVFFIFFAIQLITCLSFAQVDPEIQWKVLKLPHFDLIYDAKHQELAELYADRLEDNRQYLTQYFQIFPDRVTVILNDRTDLTNGYATPIPYQTMMLYPALPGPQETIGDYGDWARELTLHEYTHSLSFQPRRGVIKGLYYTFGSIITPNILLPRWWLEGLAVDLETRSSNKGRLKSPYQDGSIRAYVLENKLQSVQLAEINETSIHTWPQGGRPYLFGSLMWSELIARYGAKNMQELLSRYGGRMPYFLEAPIQDQTGASYYQLFVDMKDSLQKKVQFQVAELGKVAFSQGPTLTVKNGIENFHPVISPDGLKMVFLSKSDSNKRSVRILVRPSLDVPFDGSQELAEIGQRFGETLPELNPSPRRIDEREGADSPPGGTIQRLAWFPDSLRFVFDKSDVPDRYHEISDLHLFDLRKMKVERITYRERAREAAVSPDSKSLVFVKLEAGRTHLALFDLTEKTSKIIYSPALQTRISIPVFLSNSEVLFSERTDGRETLKKISLPSLQVQEVLSQYPDTRFASVSKKGILFSSTMNGISNVYLTTPDFRTVRPVSHSSTFISSSSMDADRDELYVSELTTNGFQIRTLSLKNGPALPASLPKVQPLLADRYPALNHQVSSIEKPPADDYSAWPWMLPRFWLPNLYFYDGGAVIGAATAAADPLQKHAYSVAAAHETETQETSSQFLYTNNTTQATVLVKALDYNTSVVNTNIDFRQQDYETDALWEVPQIGSDFFAGVGYRWLGRDYSNVNYSFQSESYRNAETEAHGPSLLAAYSSLSMSGAQVTPESGLLFNFSATDFKEGGGLSESFRQYHLSYQQYLSKWLPRHHAIMYRLQGLFTDQNVGLANYSYTVPYVPFANALGPTYIMRGYLNGQFLGKSIANYTFEYRFPIWYIYHGGGTAPIFFKRVHGAVIADGATVDGYAYSNDRGLYERIDPWHTYWSTGLELKLDITLGYHFPMTVFAGWYTPQDKTYDEGQRFTIGIQL